MTREDPTDGSAFTRVVRVGYDADYPDGVGDLLAEHFQPNARTVSNAVHRQVGSLPNARGLSDWAVHWGQFLTHDLSLIRTGVEYDRLSTGAVGDFSIPALDPGDPLAPGMAFHRSQFDPTTGDGRLESTPRGLIPVPRWQINANTSYLDASQVYGSDAATAVSLRTLAGGKLRTSAGGLLPGTDAAGAFLAGDERANENVALTAIHALFIREHNRLADLLRRRDATLSDEQLYQWSRKIVGAELQAITYREFLPALMGPLAPRAGDYFYDENDPSITTAFSTAAFRYGHSMQSPRLQLVDGQGNEAGQISLRTASDNPAWLAADPQRVDLLLAGLAAQVAQENDAYVVDALRNIPFGPPGAGAGGSDLAALDIQRGRDHGLISSYHSLRQAYGLPPISQFAELTSDPVIAARLASVYDSLGSVDAWPAMIAEDHLPGSSLGLLAQTIIERQFVRLRDGDRFFFTGDPDLQNPLVTAIIDLDALTLADVIRRNTGVTRLPANVFFVAVPEPSVAALLVLATLAQALRARRS